MFGRVRKGRECKGAWDFQILGSNRSEVTPLRRWICCPMRVTGCEARAPTCSHSPEHLCPQLLLSRVMFTCACSFCYFLWGTKRQTSPTFSPASVLFLSFDKEFQACINTSPFIWRVNQVKYCTTQYKYWKSNSSVFVIYRRS